MSLAAFESFLMFAESAIASKASWPATVDTVELESALVGYGVILLHSHMEKCVRRAVDLRCIRCSDEHIRAFAMSVSDDKGGKIGIAFLNQTLNRFSGEYRNSFQVQLNSSGLNSSWDSIINHRKKLAHEGSPASLSLADLRLFFEDIRNVLGLFCAALELAQHEVQDVSPLIVVPVPTVSPTESVAE
jgi:hypothetical protein